MKVYLGDERPTPEGWVRAYTVSEAVKLLKTGNVSHLSLDHDLGPAEAGTGYDICKAVEELVFFQEPEKSTFDFELFDYEVAFEFRDTSFFGRLLGRKKEHLVYYIRLCSKCSEGSNKELVLSRRRDSYTHELEYQFEPRGNESWGWRTLFWNNPQDPENLLTRAYMRHKPSKDNVIFSTASFEGRS